jgi:hypothetical protein
MVQYYNFTKLGDSDGGLISFWQFMSVSSNNFFSYFLIALIFIIPLVYMVQRGEEVNRSVNLSSFWALMLSIILYVSQILNNPIAVFICALMFVTTAGIRFYHKD